MTTFHIKIIAIILMVLDHIAAYLFPEAFPLRILGRLSFPLFAWLIANGVIYSSSKTKYLLRLLLLAVISQIPFVLVNDLLANPLEILNIFFTLSFGLVIIAISNKTHHNWLKAIIMITGVLIGWRVGVEYGAAGVLSIIAFYHTYQNIRVMAWLQLVIFTAFYTIPIGTTLWQLGVYDPPIDAVIGLFQPAAAASVVLISQYNREKGPSVNLLFYLFYPIHLLVIYGLMLLIR